VVKGLKSLKCDLKSKGGNFVWIIWYLFQNFNLFLKNLKMKNKLVQRLDVRDYIPNKIQGLYESCHQKKNSCLIYGSC
jgi:hypothetical protein